ncbi:flagellar hook protein FlgE [Parablautia muri]|uniref:Flagellar hook protein FlgE n=1 Tax=Parablautia muri TaxID=2320879 RepID=A0A9X5BGF0_9FIRM|nr:flagellar hook protein FlgE [Parablautia muri]NBJ93510.1 flagellar hook protein FlgE [Parablautia muri]
MMRSLFSGVAGLRTHQARMDVIGNNIANVNTTAYKSQSMTFADLMYQTTQAASGANPTTGVAGTNARQIGLGSKTSAIKTNISGQGSAQNTNDPFDIMISGDAFFVVSNGSENFFTRDGSFYIDGKGNLAMTSTGYNVMGWGVDPENPNNIQKARVQALKIMTEENMTYPPEATSLATVGGLVDKNDPDINNDDGRILDLEFFDNQGYKYTARMSVHAIDGDTGQFYVKLDDVISESTGRSIMYELDNDGNYTTDPPTLTANGNAITFGDGATGPTGVDNAVLLNYRNGKGTFQSIGEAHNPDKDYTTVGNRTVTLGLSGIPNFGDIEIDFSATSNYDNNGVATISAYAGDQSGLGEGRREGELSGVSIQRDGKIYASYDNGQRKLLGQIASATFANPSGLSKEGDNLYSATLNSGDFDGIGEDITAGGGKMESGVLEMSNVDLASEFTEMITTQRGFQANSRIITVSDTLLEELTNLKR